jgi:hypothetical protein
MLLVFVVVLLFYIGPLDAISTAPLPLIYVIYGATGSKAATNILISLVAVILFFALFNIFASVSRLVWVFASDKGLPFSNFFAYVSYNNFLLSLQEMCVYMHLLSTPLFPCFLMSTFHCRLFPSLDQSFSFVSVISVTAVPAVPSESMLPSPFLKPTFPLPLQT